MRRHTEKAVSGTEAAILLIASALLSATILTMAEPVVSKPAQQQQQQITRAYDPDDLAAMEQTPVETYTRTAPIVTPTIIEAEPLSEPAQEPSEASEAEAIIYYDIPLTNAEQDLVRAVSDEYGVPFDLTLAIMKAESGFNPAAVSSTNDHGIMQINECNHEFLRELLGITDFYDLEQGTRAGCYFIGGYLEKYNGDVAAALMAYNLGPTGAARRWEQGIYTTKYTERIMKAREELCAK